MAALEEELPDLWPPRRAPAVSDALRASVPIAPELDHWTSPEVAVCAVVDVVACRGGVVALLAGAAGPFRETGLAFWRPGGALLPVAVEAFPSAPAKPSRLWPAAPEDAPAGGAFLAHCGGSLWRVELPPPGASGESPSGGAAIVAAASLLFTPPPGAGGLSCCVGDGGAPLCAFFVPPPDVEQTGPRITLPGQSLSQLPAAKLCAFSAQRGLRAVVDVPRLSEQPLLSCAGGRAVCVWRAMLNEVPEEAERGEFLACELSAPEPRAVCLTRGAGRVGGAVVAGGGELIVIQANFSADRPVTTHMALELLAWPAGEAAPRSPGRRLLTGEHVLAFGFVPPSTSSSVGQPRRLFATSLAGVDPETVLWELDRAASDLQGDGGPAASPKLPSAVLSRSAVAVGRPTAWPAEEGSAQGELLVFGTEEADRLPSLAALPAGPAPAQPAAALRQPLPQPPGCAELRIEKVVYTHRGQSVTALLCERAEPPLPPNAPLLVHVHGGPAIGVVCSQRMAADAWRYPYRHFLVAGFRVLQPLFRGTLGFGDAWAQANIGGQGSLDGDLGDVLAGLDFLNNHHERLRGTIEKSRTGIWGGSYGGYLTLRAMSEVPERFGAGVALYGFVHNRWMTYEGGDFTWEDEYLVPPPQEAAGACFEMELVEQEVPAAVLAATAAAAAESASQGPRRSFTGRSRASSGDSGARARAASSDIWPLPKEMEASDNFNGLHRISSPLLLMHGEKDDICPLSQSQVAFHMLEKLGVPTGLVVYPGEGHGFDQPEHQQDRDRRMLAWFTEHLAPPGGPGSPPA